ncbi:DUF930 domain-containing protein [Neorhizobium alkalisoli]|jgi:hypothetical protein|uniref:Uncharacterized protein DUF930 n=1 Tax=Neorhizobium alkalisoli TaxID=528178 RepID=A0A561QWK9_9HYPH|nr:DUF930 domain-containing protein [Neorhizobium alkalisoli]TWF54757.1 uncharacterized protein DUF930 [Neorhizobium alkalisoli]
MKKTLALAALALFSASAAHALDNRIVKQLNALAPEERREQRCDMEAMDQIRKEGDFRPDKVIAYTFEPPVAAGDDIKAPGAVFRSGGDWYRLKYKCQTGDKGLKIMSFDFKVGSKISRDDWEKYYLYD